MNFPKNAVQPTLIAALCSAALLSACGGSGGGGDLAAAMTTISGTSMPGATAQVGMRDNGVKTATADASTGAYSMTLETGLLITTSDNNTPPINFFATLSKDRYRSCVSDPFNLTTSSNNITIKGCSTLTALGVGEFEPVGGVTLTRLGNGDAQGENNSQLQVKLVNSSVPNKTYTLVKASEWGSSYLPSSNSYNTLTVTISFRGLGVTTTDSKAGGAVVSTCPDDAVTISDGTFSKTFNRASGLTNSPADGSFGDQTFQVAVGTGGISAGKDVTVKIESPATCVKTDGSALTDPMDDFEFKGIFGKFS